MLTLAIIAQVVIAVGIVNVWLFRYDRDTEFRPAGASNMREEFRTYGLPEGATFLVGGAKLLLAALLVVGIFWRPVAAPAAALMGVLMLGAIGAHIRVDDPIRKALPATLMLGLSILVVVGQTL